MEILKQSTGQTLFNLTLYAGDTLASPLAQQESDKAKMTHATYGLGLDSALANYDPDTQSWKMYGDTYLWGDSPLLESLPVSGMTRNGVLYPQPVWERIIDGTESSSWPTPTAVTRPMEGNVRLYRAKIQAGEMTEPEAEAILGKSVWEAQGAIPAMWPTPRVTGSHEKIETIQERFKNGLKYKQRLEEAVALWPTMSASGMGNTGSQQMLQKHVEAGSLTSEEKRAMTAGNGGRLNPMWVEWLMGFPTGWTDLEASETP
jgi:hypothetical protein